jgi:hypothetical protein
MLLDPAQVKQVIDYLNHYKIPTCAICEHDDWEVSAAIFELPEHRPPVAPRFGGFAAQVFPVIPLTCKICGNVLLLSAIATRVIPGPAQVPGGVIR